MIAGFVNRVARINLTTGAITYEELNEGDVRKYIGARGLGVKYVLDNGPEVDALSPDNLLCIMNGPLTGTEVKMSGRLAVVTKSPLTGTVTDSHIGGWTAAKLKWAGFDGLLITGKAESPVYLYVEDGQVRIEDASVVWGMETGQTINYLQREHHEDCSIMAIGPAGENLVKYANWINENERAAGRGGTGAVAGSKNLKAIVIMGDRSNQPKPADRPAFREADKKALAGIMNEDVITAPRKGGLSVYGTNVLDEHGECRRRAAGQELAEHFVRTGRKHLRRIRT